MLFLSLTTVSFSAVSNFFRLLFSCCCCCVERKEEILPLSLSLKLTALLSPRRTKEEEEEEEEKRFLFSLSLSLSLSKRTSEKLFLRARLFRLHEEKDFVLLFSSSLSSTVCVWRDNSTPKPHKKMRILRASLRRCCSLFFRRSKKAKVSLFLYYVSLSLFWDVKRVLMRVF